MNKKTLSVIPAKAGIYNRFRIKCGMTLMSVFLLAFCFNLQSQEKNLRASVVKAVGKYNIMRSDKGVWEKASVGELLYEGDRVQTAKKSKILVIFLDGVEVSVNEQSEFDISPQDTIEEANIRIKIGQLWNKVVKRQTKFTVHTPVAIATVRGTEFEVSVLDTGITSVSVMEGKVEVKNQKGSVEVGAGQKTEVGGNDAPPAEPVEEKKETREKKSEWKDAVKVSGKINVELEAASAMIKNTITAKVNILDDKNEPMASFSDNITVTSGNKDIVLSADKNKWASEIKVKCLSGKAEFFIISDKAGSGNVQVAGSDLAVRSFIVSFTEPAGKNIFINYEKEDGKTGSLKLKYKK